MSLLTKQQLHELIVDLTKYCPEAESDIEYLEAEFLTTLDYVEKLLCENEIHEQCIANIIDTKPGGSIEGQMIAATQACVRAEQRNEELEAELKELKEANDFLREHSEAQADRIDELPELWAETAKLRAELATLKKDARLCAEYIKPLWHEKHNTPNPLKEAVYRILEATKEEP